MSLSEAQFGPYYHGTTHELQPGQHLSAKGAQEAGLNFPASTGQHVYFSSNLGIAADYGEPHHRDDTSIGRVYQVEPTSKRFSRDPGLKGPGYDPNDYQQSFRTTGRLKVVRELGESDMGPQVWQRLQRNAPAV